MSMGGDFAIESMTHNLLKLLIKKVEENPNNSELKKVLGEVGNWAIEELQTWPPWVYEFRDKFR